MRLRRHPWCGGLVTLPLLPTCDAAACCEASCGLLTFILAWVDTPATGIEPTAATVAAAAAALLRGAVMCAQASKNRVLPLSTGLGGGNLTVMEAGLDFVCVHTTEEAIFCWGELSGGAAGGPASRHFKY